MANEESGMKTLFVGLSLIVSCAVLNAARVPPPGLAISEKDRAELRTGADALAREITALRSAPMAELLPDVEIFHKAVDWALRYDEFYRSNEVGLARALLQNGTERAKQLREGKPAWLTATGLVVRGYASRLDGSVQPYGLVVPASFRAGDSKVHRLDVWLHGRDNNLTELKFLSDRQRSYGEFTPADAFVLHPYGRYCNAFKFAGEVDVFEAMEHVKRSYRIDNQRIPLRGFSMGGAGVWHLAAHHPHVWAVAAPGAGFSETAAYTKALSKEPKPSAWEQKLWQLYDATDYAANFFNLPVVAYNGELDDQKQAADMMERAMKAEGLTLPRVLGTNIGHKYTPVAKEEVNEFVDRAVKRQRDVPPQSIHFTTRTLRFNQFPGGEILALKQHWARADLVVDQSMPRQTVIRTTNITAFSLRRYGWGTQETFIIDGKTIRATNDLIVNRSGSWWANFRRDGDEQWTVHHNNHRGSLSDLSKPRKTPGRQGPIDDAFMESFLMVRPTGKARSEQLGTWVSSRLASATNDWRAQFRGDARVKNDSAVTEADIAAHNLILFGDPQSNRLLARIVDKLPIQWSAGTLKVGDKTFSAATHIPVLIFPNPLNPEYYIVLNSGFTFAAAGSASNARQTPKLPDYAVLDIESDDAVVLADFFDEQWRLR